MKTHAPLSRRGTLAVESLMDSFWQNMRADERYDEHCDGDLLEGCTRKERWYLPVSKDGKSVLIKGSATFSKDPWISKLCLHSRIKVKRGRQSLLMSREIELGDYQTMLRAHGRSVELGGFFCRPSELRNRIQDILYCQHHLEPLALGISIWQTILDCGGVDCLLEIWEDLLEHEIMYKLRLNNPFLF